MMRSLCIFFLIVIPLAGMQAQDKPMPGDWMKKIGVGGNVGLRFGDVTYVELSPVVGYRLASFIMPGIGGSYRYYKDRYSNTGINIWGASAWVRVYPLPMIFGYAEHEELYGAFDYYFPQRKYFIGTNFVGAGYSQELGNNSTYIMLLFAVNQDPNSIYRNPILRVGFMIGGNAE